MTENAQPSRNAEASVLELALRVIRGEMTEAEFLEIAKRQGGKA